METTASCNGIPRTLPELWDPSTLTDDELKCIVTRMPRSVPVPPFVLRCKEEQKRREEMEHMKRQARGAQRNREMYASEIAEETPSFWQRIAIMAADAGSLARSLLQSGAGDECDAMPCEKTHRRKQRKSLTVDQLEERVFLSGASLEMSDPLPMADMVSSEVSSVQMFSRLSGNAVITDVGITFSDRSFVVSKPLPERQPGETYETRITLTLRPSDDTHFYLYNDTAGYNAETGHGVILMPERDYENIGVVIMRSGEAKVDNRDSAPLPYGQYMVTMTDTDTEHTTIIRLPSGHVKTYTQPQLPRVHGGQIFLNAGGTTITSMQVIRKNKAVAPIDRTEGSSLEALIAEIEECPVIEEPTEQSSSVLSAFRAKQASLQEKINTLMVARTDIATQILRQQTLLSDADVMLSEANAILKRREQQALMESQKVTPHLSVQTLRLKPYLEIQYSNMPSGYLLRMDGRGAGWSSALNQGSFSGRVDLPRFGASGSASVYLTDNTGTRVTELFHFNHTSGSSPSKTGAKSYNEKLTGIAYVPEIAPELRVSSAEMAQAHSLMADAATQRSNAEQSIAHLQSQSADMREAINALERSMIPYNRMHVAAEGSGFVLHYMASGTQTYFEVDLRGAGSIYRETIDHVAGQADGSMRFDIGRAMGGNGDGPVTIRMYDRADGTLLDAFTGSFSRKTGKTEGESIGVWGELETGRIVENPLSPTMSVLDVFGPMVVVAMQSPYDASVINFDGGGFFGNASMTHEGGSSYKGHLFSINTDKPGGVYTLRMFEGVNRREVCSLSFRWDTESKTLTPLGGHNEWISGLADETSSEHAAELRSMAKALYGLPSTSLSFAALRNVQQTQLFDASHFVISEAELAEILTRFPIQNHPDRSSIFQQGVGAREGVIGELLEVSVNATINALQGASQVAGREYFQTQYSVLSGNRYLREFMIDFRMAFPSAEEIFEEGQMLAQKRIDTLVRNQAKLASELRRESFLANQDGPVETRNPSDEALERNRAIVVSKHGEGSAQVRAYDAAWGSVIVAANTTQGQMYETLVGSERTVETGGGGIDVREAPTSENTMIMVIYGSNQFPGQPSSDDGSFPGFDRLVVQLQQDYPETWAMPSGQNQSVGIAGLSTKEASESIQRLILNRTQKNAEITNIIIVGYSWGGGMTYDTAEWLTTNSAINIAGTVYVDAVMVGNAYAENRLPPGTQSMLNIFQSDSRIIDDTLLQINGGAIESHLLPKDFIEIDFDKTGNFATHSNIDEQARMTILNYIHDRILPTA